MRPSGSPGRPHGRCRWSAEVSDTLPVKARASLMAGHLGLGDGLGAGIAIAVADTSAWSWLGPDALAALSWSAAPAAVPSATPPMIAPSLVIFIVALTTRRLMRLVRNCDLLKSGVTYAGHEPFMRTRSGTAPLRRSAEKSVASRAHADRIVDNVAWRNVPGSEGQAQHAIH